MIETIEQLIERGTHLPMAKLSDADLGNLIHGLSILGDGAYKFNALDIGFLLVTEQLAREKGKAL